MKSPPPGGGVGSVGGMVTVSPSQPVNVPGAFDPPFASNARDASQGATVVVVVVGATVVVVVVVVVGATVVVVVVSGGASNAYCPHAAPSFSLVDGDHPIAVAVAPEPFELISNFTRWPLLPAPSGPVSDA